MKEKTVADYRTMYDRDYLYAYDLQGRDVTVTISAIKAGVLKDNKGKSTKKPILYFREAKDGRGLAICKTNGKTIAQLYGNDVEQWIGQRITLFPTTTDVGGETRECIRVRPRKPDTKTVSSELRSSAEPPPSGPEMGAEA
jgi:hypothetical protein